jgi:hypothetical protein
MSSFSSKPTCPTLGTEPSTTFATFFTRIGTLFTEVISKKGTTYKVKKIHSDKEFYLVTNGEFHAHGDTPEKAKEDFNKTTPNLERFEMV